MVRAVIFDLYGTLARIDDPYLDLLKMMPRSSRENVANAIVTRQLHSFDEVMCMIERDYRVHFKGEEMERKIGALRARAETLDDTITLYDDAIPALERTRREGLKIGLISNAPSALKGQFYRLGLDAFITDPVFSCDVGMRKPDKRIFALACERLRTAPHETVMIGDNKQHDIDGASHAGLHALYLSREKYSTRNHIRSLDELRPERSEDPCTYA